MPLLDLTHILASRGLTITILVTPKNLSLLTPLLSKHPFIDTLVLPFPAHSSLPHGVENAKDMPFVGIRAIMHALGELYNPLLQWFQNHPSPPVIIVSDFLLGWTYHLACQLGIRRFMFSPSSAVFLSVFYSVWRYQPKRDDPNDEKALIKFPRVPNCPIYPWWQLPVTYRSYVEGDPVSEFVKDGFLSNMASWGLVVNPFNELERVYLDHLMEILSHDRVWAVGPLLPPIDDRSGLIERGGSSSVLPSHQMEELALGLEKSGVKFIWCVKELTKGHVEGQYGVVPSGFEDRVAKKGLVIREWAPQVLILSHQAVGAFLTHCGWNSIVEGIFAGEPMLTWPMGADQFVSAKLLVVCKNRVELVRVVELREAALEAIKESGSSSKDLDDLIRHLLKGYL
ncbi:hypothetical protein ACSBR2_041717 [Camellia fascicularis]